MLYISGILAMPPPPSASTVMPPVVMAEVVGNGCGTLPGARHAKSGFGAEAYATSDHVGDNIVCLPQTQQ